MVKLNEYRPTGTKALIEAKMVEGDKRTYLGMSGIGHTCRRYLWYTFRWAYTEYFTPRQMRLFGRGHKEEPVIVAELAKIGVEVTDCVDGQAAYTSVFGHYRGHSDGNAHNVPEAPKTTHLAEFKTINDKGFKDLKKKGVKLSKPIYYAQMQAYMQEEKLTRALFIAVNKNDDSWYVERVKFDKGYAADLTRKAEEIIVSTKAPARELPKGWFECRWCAAQDICEGRVPMDKSCRTCIHSEPNIKGGWDCIRFKIELGLGTQKQGKDCPKYEQINYND